MILLFLLLVLVSITAGVFGVLIVALLTDVNIQLAMILETIEGPSSKDQRVFYHFKGSKES